MSVNNLTFQQAATLLNTIHGMVTGSQPLAITDLRDFVSVGQLTLKQGTDPVMNAISQLVGRTIFSDRKYRRRFEGLYADSQRFGYITRKLSLSDTDWDNDTSFELADGQIYTNQFKVCKPKVMQMNFYGQNVFKRCYTTFRNQLNSAFDSPASLGQFLGMVTTHVQNMVEQNNESIARATLVNFITGKIAANNGVINLLKKYNDETGAGLTTTTVYAPANFPEFARWAYGYINTLSDLLTERTGLYQIQVTGKEVMRHTPKEMQKTYMLASFLNAMKARVNATTYNEGFLSLTDVEPINFWQSAQTPAAVNAKPVYLKADGTLEEADTAVNEPLVLGVIFDQDALGLTIMDEWSATSPFEASEGYYTTWLHFVQRWWNDFTEKGVIFILKDE